MGFFNFEYPLIRWLEMKGYYVTYQTDIDTHTSPGTLASNKHQAFLSNGHDEYWSWQMRNNVEQARDRSNSGSSKPINIGFFGGNIAYWQIRLVNSTATGTQPANAPNRTIVCYKEFARVDDYGDPYYLGFHAGPTHPLYPYSYLTSFWWRDNQTVMPPSTGFYPTSLYFQPEDEMEGIMTIRSGGDDEHPATSPNGYQPIFGAGSNPLVLVTSPIPTRTPWYAIGTVGKSMPNMIGYESDELYPNHYTGPHAYTNRTLTILGSSPFLADRPENGANCNCGTKNCSCSPYYLGDAETTFYKKTDNSARVLAASGQQWSWGLDNWGADPAIGPTFTGRYLSANADSSKITENIMNCLVNQNTPCN